jgi:hypothetical protein
MRDADCWLHVDRLPLLTVLDGAHPLLAEEAASSTSGSGGTKHKKQKSSFSGVEWSAVRTAHRPRVKHRLILQRLGLAQYAPAALVQPADRAEDKQQASFHPFLSSSTSASASTAASISSEDGAEVPKRKLQASELTLKKRKR